MLGLFLALFLPPTGSPAAAQKASARNDAYQIAASAAAFQKEYGYFPATGHHVVGGELLTALMGSNGQMNPRNICFLEVDPAKKGRGGLTNGIFVDPWGGFYQIAFADGTNAVTAGTNRSSVRKPVAVWNEPTPSADQPWWNREDKLSRRYVTSWD